MRLLCDVHIPIKFVKWLISQGHDALHANRLPKSYYTSDIEICRFADIHDYIVVTKDADFRETHLVCGTPRKLIRILLGNATNEDLQDMFFRDIQVIESRFALGGGYFEVYRDRIVFHSREKEPIP